MTVLATWHGRHGRSILQGCLFANVVTSASKLSSADRSLIAYKLAIRSFILTYSNWKSAGNEKQYSNVRKCSCVTVL